MDKVFTPVAWQWLGTDGETITAWRPENVESVGLYGGQVVQENRKLREALQVAVDAIAFYLRPESLDGGAGECAAITNAAAAEKIAIAALNDAKA